MRCLTKPSDYSTISVSMKKRDGIIKFILKPPMRLCIAVWTAGTLALAGSLTLYYIGLGLKPWAWAVHVSAFVFVLLSVYAVLTVIGIPERVKDKPRVRQFFSSYNTRGFVYAFCSAVFNTAYVVFGIVIANVEQSAWLGVLVGYHIFLLLPRAEVLVTAKLKARGEDSNRQKQQLRAYANCGLILILLALAIIPVIRMTLNDENSYNYFISTIVYVISIALYTTVKVVVALYNFRKARKQNDMALIAVKNISLADALISVFTLQAMMLKELGDESGLLAPLGPTLGAVVALGIFAMGLYMLVVGNKRLKKLETQGPEKDDDEENGRIVKR